MIWQSGIPKDMAAAAAALRRGEVVAFPTETVYGLGADGLNGKACAKIFVAKGRPMDNPLILHIGDLSQLPQVVSAWPETAKRLAEAFWPGPLTMVLPKAEVVPDEVTAGLTTVAVRFPNHTLAQDLINEVGKPLAAPSANLSGKPSPTLACHVEHDLGNKIAGVIDGGACEIGVESTIIDLSIEQPTILRPGGISVEAIEAIIGPVRVDRSLVSDEGAIPKAPGMKYRHYAPEAPAKLVKHEHLPKLLMELRMSVRPLQECIGFLLSDESLEELDIMEPSWLTQSLGSRSKPEEAAQRLYAALRAFDEAGVSRIFIESYETRGMGLALMNRLQKIAVADEEGLG